MFKLTGPGQSDEKAIVAGRLHLVTSVFTLYSEMYSNLTLFSEGARCDPDIDGYFRFEANKEYEISGTARRKRPVSAEISDAKKLRLEVNDVLSYVRSKPFPLFDFYDIALPDTLPVIDVLKKLCFNPPTPIPAAFDGQRPILSEPDMRFMKRLPVEKDALGTLDTSLIGSEAPSAVSIIGPSGAGKTKIAFDYCIKDFNRLYFVAPPPDIRAAGVRSSKARKREAPSEDMILVCREIDRVAQSSHSIDELRTLEASAFLHISALIATRLLCLLHYRTSINPYKWLLMQLPETMIDEELFLPTYKVCFVSCSLWSYATMNCSIYMRF